MRKRLPRTFNYSLADRAVNANEELQEKISAKKGWGVIT
jgi:hypothetical protein